MGNSGTVQLNHGYTEGPPGGALQIPVTESLLEHLEARPQHQGIFPKFPSQF